MREEKTKEKINGPRENEMKRGERRDDFVENVSEPSNTPDESAQNVSKKNPSRTNYSSFFFECSKS